MAIPDQWTDVTIVRPARELDCSSGPVLVQRLNGALKGVRTTPIEIPLDQVRFIDAAGMRSLVRCHELALHSRRSVTFTDPSSAVRRLAELFGGLSLPFGPIPLDEN